MLRVPSWITAMLVACGLAESAAALLFLAGSSPDTTRRSPDPGAAVQKEAGLVVPIPGPVADAELPVERERRELPLYGNPPPARDAARETENGMVCNDHYLEWMQERGDLLPSQREPQ